MKKILTIVFVLSIIIALAVFISGYANAQRTQLYTGRTTLMLAGNKQSNIDDLMQLASSNRVLTNSDQTLKDLGLYKIDNIYNHLIVKQVKDTNIISVEVILPDPNDAKIAADVVANEVRKACKEMSTGKNDCQVKVIDSAYVFPVASRANFRLMIALLITSIVVIVIFAVGFACGLRSKNCPNNL